MKITVSIHSAKNSSADYVGSMEIDLATLPRIGEEIAVVSGDSLVTYRVFDVSWEVYMPDGAARTPIVRAVVSKSFV